MVIWQAAKAAGLSEAVTEKLLKATQSQAIKDALKKNTNEALEHGVSPETLVLFLYLDKER